MFLVGKPIDRLTASSHARQPPAKQAFAVFWPIIPACVIDGLKAGAYSSRLAQWEIVGSRSRKHFQNLLLLMADVWGMMCRLGV